jgi:hypothetical protein
MFLKNNLLIHSMPFLENTAKVIPPNPSFPNGMIVLSAGEPRNLAKILYRPLLDQHGTIDTLSETPPFAFPIGSTRALASDNQIVRLKEGNVSDIAA